MAGEDPTVKQGKWTVRTVAEEVLRDKVTERAKDLNAGETGNVPFVSKWQTALTEIVDGLDDVERKELETTVEIWNTQRPPRKVQHR